MKKPIFQFCIALLFLAGVQMLCAQLPPSKAPTGATTIFSEGFEDCTNAQLPAGWTYNNTPKNDYNNWWTSKNLNINDTWLAHGDSGQLVGVRADGTVANNCWMVTPALNLTAGKEYRIKFWLRMRQNSSTTQMDRFEVRIGQSNDVFALVSETLLYNFSAPRITDWTQITTTFVANSSVSHYIGFHCFSPARGGAIAIDDVLVEEVIARENDMAMLSLPFTVFPYRQIPSRQVPAVQARNIGVQTQTKVSVSATLNGGTTVVSDTLESLATYKTGTFTLPNMPINIGANTLSFAVSQAEADDDPSDNTSSISFTGTDNMLVLDDGAGGYYNSGNHTFVLGSVFPISQTTTLNQVRLRRHVLSSDIDNVAKTVTVYVYKMMGDNLLPEPLVAIDADAPMEPYNHESLTDWFNVNIPPTDLIPGRYYIAATSAEIDKRLYMGLDNTTTRPNSFLKNGNALTPYGTGRTANLRLITDLSDAGITAITIPAANDLYTDAETLSVKIKNHATVRMDSGIYVNALIDGVLLYERDSLIWNTLATALDVNEVREFTLTTALDLSAKGPHSIKVYAYGTSESEEQRTNDTMTLDVVNSYQTDLEVVECLSPMSGVLLSRVSKVEVNILNRGIQNVTDVPVTLKLNNVEQATEIIPEIRKGDTVTFSFEKRLDLSAEGDYEITIFTDLPAEENRANDTLVHNVHCDLTTIHDAQMVEFITPLNGELSDAETITIRVKNNGNTPITSLPISLLVNDEMLIEQTFITNIPLGGTELLTFDETLNLSEGGTYNLKAILSHRNDNNPDGDTLDYAVVNTLPYNLSFGFGLTTGIIAWEQDDPENRIGFNVYYNGLLTATSVTATHYALTVSTSDTSYMVGVEVIYPAGVLPMITKIIKLQKPTSIEDVDSQTDVVIYPNPVNDRLFIQSDAPLKRLEIYDLQGRLVKVQNGNPNEIDVNDMKAGMYLIRLTTETGVTTQRIIKL